ncbi:hypothetical protein [Actinomadura macrotermitis]|uniref:Uncharacterized protein n=1 Tax=Actinomadura macrotermitis TaxID=2585200 RepID=A0A7K0C6T7_9ACTN|nr:hypothetical protein [Actinomadura macrotermitis]MQY09145.1 hypothetical protein [Actinomadura macrotermitis]
MNEPTPRGDRDAGLPGDQVPPLPRRGAATGDTRVAGAPPASAPAAGGGAEATLPDGPREDAPEAPGAAAPKPAAAPGTPHGNGSGFPETPSGESPIERLLDPAEADRFKERWHDLQASFVDDPHDAVQRADELSAEVVNALGQALTAHKRTLDEGWRTEKEDERPDTERLRLALRGYRQFLDRMLAS